MGDDDLLEQMLEEQAAKGPVDQQAILKALGEDEPEPMKDDKVSQEAIDVLENGPKEDTKDAADLPQVVQDVIEQGKQALTDLENKLGSQLSGLGEISYVLVNLLESVSNQFTAQLQ